MKSFSKIKLLVFAIVLSLLAFGTFAACKGEEKKPEKHDRVIYKISDAAFGAAGSEQYKANRFTASCLQGLANKNGPELFIVYEGTPYGGYLDGLKNDYGYKVEALDGMDALLAKFIGAVPERGYTLYDAAVGSALNVATTVCSAAGYLPLTAAQSAKAVQWGLTQKQDLTASEGTKAKDEAWALERYGDKLNKKMLANVGGGQYSNRDYYVSHSAFVFDNGDEQYLEKLYADFAAMNAVVFTDKEHSAFNDARSVITVNANGLDNISLLSRADTGKGVTAKRTEEVTADPAKHYVAIEVMADEKLADFIGGFQTLYKNTARGDVPLTFGVNSAVAELMPTVLQATYHGANAGDDFISAGYGSVVSDRYEDIYAYSDKMQAAMQKGDMNYLSITSSSVQPLTVEQLGKKPNIYGGTFAAGEQGTEGAGALIWNKGKPFVAFSEQLDASEIAALTEKIIAKEAKTDAIEGYTLVRFDPARATMAELKTFAQGLSSHVELVTVSQLLRLVEDNVAFKEDTGGWSVLDSSPLAKAEKMQGEVNLLMKYSDGFITMGRELEMPLQSDVTLEFMLEGWYGDSLFDLALVIDGQTYLLEEGYVLKDRDKTYAFRLDKYADTVLQGVPYAGKTVTVALTFRAAGSDQCKLYVDSLKAVGAEVTAERWTVLDKSEDSTVNTAYENVNVYMNYSDPSGYAKIARLLALPDADNLTLSFSVEGWYGASQLDLSLIVDGTEYGLETGFTVLQHINEYVFKLSDYEALNAAEYKGKTVTVVLRFYAGASSQCKLLGDSLAAAAGESELEYDKMLAIDKALGAVVSYNHDGGTDTYLEYLTGNITMAQLLAIPADKDWAIAFTFEGWHGASLFDLAIKVEGAKYMLAENRTLKQFINSYRFALSDYETDVLSGVAYKGKTITVELTFKKDGNFKDGKLIGGKATAEETVRLNTESMVATVAADGTTVSYKHDGGTDTYLEYLTGNITMAQLLVVPANEAVAIAFSFEAWYGDGLFDLAIIVEGTRYILEENYTLLQYTNSYRFAFADYEEGVLSGADYKGRTVTVELTFKKSGANKDGKLIGGGLTSET